MSFLPTLDDYVCDRCRQTMAETQDQGFLCICGGTFKLRMNVFSIHGLEWDYTRKGYHPERDNPEGEVKWDMKKMEQRLDEVHNLKDYYRGKRALKRFERAHKDILK